MAPPLVSRPDSGRRQPLLGKETSSASRFAETAGGTMASCAAVCCCCPCGLVNLLVLAMVKLPAGLCKRALRRKKREKKRRKDVLIPNRSELQVHPVRPAPTRPENSPEIAGNWPEKSPEKQVEEMDAMWEKMHTGFWRSISEREQ
ncbi:uncharacterized protein LOC18437561 [Amborella trichopoda]|uniref:Uncharacterized protein n=1 Tax=Amborella trichopoda TaxID=13333 RepID=W1PHE0_AMBTC|nr:uncharacterized protein LOC18437561 [Amborella trichopoda]ERN09412.1 hypothetical protein AMTR_s00029p00052430 [Amborella trichopoda]|eukprot:XP_006847831.1 uncharacterized protein LOC18437561 [Amborella trichopoda]